MQRINSMHEFEALLRAERAVLFIFFPWSAGSVQSDAIVADWQKQAVRPGYQFFLLTPDDHPFTWRWLDNIFGDGPEQERTRGTIVWLRNGSVTAMVSDAALAGTKMLERVTKECFVLGKTHTRETITSLQSESPAFDIGLLKILCCPETHQALALADAALLDKVNRRLAAGRLQNRAGQPVREKVEDGLVRADGRYLYPMRRNIPVLLVDEAIPVEG